MRIRRELKRAGVADAKDYHPVVELAKIATDPTVPPMIRYSANEAVARYVSARPAPVDVEGRAVAPQIQVVLANYAGVHAHRNGRQPPAIEDRSGLDKEG